MPTYEYACRHCAAEFEVFQSMRDAPLTTCPHCGQATVKRRVGRGAGIIFKGSGFYETDYKRAPEKSGNSSSSEKQGGDQRSSSDGAAATAPASGGGTGTTAAAKPAGKE